MKIPESKYKSNVLRGRDLQDSEIVTIKAVDTVTFNEGKADEREAVSVSVEGENAKGQFSPNMKNLKVLVDNFTDETDKWIGKEIRITPVPSQTPEGAATTTIAITVAKKK